MKTFLVFVFVIVATNALSKEFITMWKGSLQAIGQKCAVETNASPDNINDILGHRIPESHEGKCLVFCMHKALHIQKENGDLDKEGTIKAMEPLKKEDEEMYNKVLPVIDHCEANTKVDADPCITAANILVCSENELGKLKISAAEIFEV